MRKSFAVAGLVIASALFVSPALARTHHRVPCKQIRDEVAAGKTAEEAAKAHGVTVAAAKRCTPQEKTAKSQK